MCYVGYVGVGDVVWNNVVEVSSVGVDVEGEIVYCCLLRYVDVDGVYFLFGFYFIGWELYFGLFRDVFGM